MKKFLMLIIGLIFVIALQAQTSGTTYVLSPTGTTSKTAFNYTKSTCWTAAQLKDSINGTAAKYWVFDIAKSNLYYFSFVCQYDTSLYHAVGKTMRTAGNHVNVVLSGSIDGVYYQMVDSVQWHPTSLVNYTAAKTVQLTDVTTGVLWRYFKITATGVDAGKCALISKLMVKVGIRY